MEAFVVSVSSSLVFFGEFCTEDVYLRPLPYNNENTDSRSTSIAQIDFRLFLSISILKCHFKYIFEKYIKPNSETYIKK